MNDFKFDALAIFPNNMFNNGKSNRGYKSTLLSNGNGKKRMP